ncbi:MAG: NfeD family protein [Longimonas sp.]|uniref:NfeD family protein n=1 Tax=Longimonas sp. TaxID=2039626 RepID=UPI003974A1B9
MQVLDIPMDAELLTWIFLLGGVLLMILETVLPGGVAFFLGVGGLLTAGLRLLGLVSDPVVSVLVWMFVSTGLTIALRPLAVRYLGGDFSFAMTDEDAEAMGQTVTVVEPLDEESAGRIRFRGATWDARTTEGRLPKGAEARILYRDNLTWIVEPVDHAALDEEFSDALNERPSETEPDTPTEDDRSASSRSSNASRTS